MRVCAPIRGTTKKSQGGTVILGKLTAALAAIGCASMIAIPAVGAQTTSGSTGDYCSPRGGLLEDAQRVVHGERADGATETTEFLANRAYRVTECAVDGSVKKTELVGPIAVPGDQTALLTWYVERRVSAHEYHGLSLTYRDPQDASWRSAWEGIEDATKDVAQPTSEAIVVAERLRGSAGTLSAPRER